MTPRTEYELVTVRGATIKTFDTRRAAMKFAADIGPTFPGSELIEVIYQAPIRRRIWREQVRLLRAAS